MHRGKDPIARSRSTLVGKAEGAVDWRRRRGARRFSGGKSGSGSRLSTVPDSRRLSRVPQDEFIGFIIKRVPRFIIYLSALFHDPIALSGFYLLSEFFERLLK